MQRVEKATVKGISTSPTPDSDPTYLTIEHLFKLATDGFIYLQSLGGFEGNPHKELQASMSVASLFFEPLGTIMDSCPGRSVTRETRCDHTPDE